MLVTPLRDGMNLVAKEFVASRGDEDGVLVLSEFAGAAWELGEALHANPYDIDHLATRIKHALEMPQGERAMRMRGMRRRVLSYDVQRWISWPIRSRSAGDTLRCAVSRSSSTMTGRRYRSPTHRGAPRLTRS
jgi:trehalose-6-phosphate synthase